MIFNKKGEGYKIAQTLITKIIKIISSLLTSIIIARILGPHGQGIYKVSLIIPSFLKNFGNFGTGQAATYYISKEKDDGYISTTINFGVVQALFLSFVGILIIFIWGQNLFPEIEKLPLYLGVLSTPFIFLTSIIGQIFLGLKEVNKYNLSNLLSVVLFLVLVSIFFYFLTPSPELVIIGYLITALIPLVYLIFEIKKRFNGYIRGINWNHVKKSINYGNKVFIGGLVNSIHYHFDAYLINLFVGPAAVGFYSIANLMSEKTWIVSQSIGEMLFPLIASSKDSKRSLKFTLIISKLNFYISITIAIILYFLSSFIITLAFGAKYKDSILPFQILLIGTISINMWRVLINYLYGKAILKLPIVISIVSVSLNIVLNIVFIPKVGIIAAATISSFTYTLLLLGIIFVFIKYTKIKFYDLIFFRKDELIYIFKKIKILK